MQPSDLLPGAFQVSFDPPEPPDRTPLEPYDPAHELYDLHDADEPLAKALVDHA